MRINPYHSNYAMHPADMMTFPFTGTAGYMTWYGYKEPNYASLCPPIIRTQNHMNGTDVINTLSEGGGSWGHGMQEEKLFLILIKPQTNNEAISHQYYISSNKDLAVGYIKNRTYNIHTNRINDNCNLGIGNKEPLDNFEDIKWNDSRLFPLSRRLRIKGLNSKTNYRIDYYSYKTGDYLSTQCDHTTKHGDEIVLKYDELKTTSDPINPVLWYVVTENGCSQSIAQNDDIQEEMERSYLLSTDGVNMENSIRLYPNPFVDKLYVETPKEDVIVITTIDGKQVIRQTVNEGNSILETTKLSTGTYIVHFILKNVQFKLVKL